MTRSNHEVGTTRFFVAVGCALSGQCSDRNDHVTTALTEIQKDRLQVFKSCDIIMMSSGSDMVINVTGGIFNNSINQTKRGIDLLMNWVATGAFHDSDELYDEPKCHPNTRLAVLDDIMKWVESEEQDDFMMWLFGPAGAGKSAIAKRIAELAAEKDLLIGTFFFSRTSSMRNSKDRLIATLAYQMTVSIPDTRTLIEDTIERDPAIFHKNLQIQIESLLIKPFQSVSTKTIPRPKLIIIDGLDECSNSQAQVFILDAISRSFSKHKLSIICLVVSRPESDIVDSFNRNEPLKAIHCRLALDDTYLPDDDICRFFSDKFEHIRRTHRLRSTIPNPWPTEESLKKLVEKSSGQFIFATTVVKFVESSRHRPARRLDVILGISPPGTMNPFTELDALYKQILSSVDDIQLTLRVLSLYAAAPNLATCLHDSLSISAEHFLSLEEGDIDLALFNLSSIVSYDQSSGEVKILHASFVDFLSDKRRSNEFYIDIVSTCTEFACRTLQCVKGPDGIAAGDISLFQTGIQVRAWILTSQLRSDILNFDFDAFITAMIKNTFKEGGKNYVLGSNVILAFIIWIDILKKKDLQVSRYLNSFESRLQKYQSDWRLQLLRTLAVVMDLSIYQIPHCRCLDILLEMDDHELHLIDQSALDLRHEGILHPLFHSEMVHITLCYVDGDSYASAALHCLLSFLSNPPKCSGRNDSPETGLMYLEWKTTCDITLDALCRLLPGANTSPKLVEFISIHDIDSAVRKKLSVSRIWETDVHILEFLNRACVCINWRIISAIQQCAMTTDDAKSDEQEVGEMTHRLLRERMDQCCYRYHYME